MNNVYTAKLIVTENPITGIFLNKKIKVVGHGPLNSQPNILSFEHADKRTSHVNRDKYIRIEYSKELSGIMEKRMREERNEQ